MKKNKIINNFYITLIIFSFLLPFFVNAQTNVKKIEVNTKDATNITSEKAKLNGSLLPSNETTYGYFRYSSRTSFPPVFCNDIFGSDMKSTNEINLGNSSVYKSFSTEVSDLEPNTTYYYCAIASDKKEIKYGPVRTFTTGMSYFSDVSITTNNALVINSTSAYLNAFYNTSSAANTWFEYKKLETKLATKKTVSSLTTWQKVGETKRNANTNGNINYVLKKLSPNTTYQFRAVISSSQSKAMIYGNTLNFKTFSTNNSYDDDYDYDYNNQNNSDSSNLSLGQSAVPPIDAVVRFQEGIEHVLARQIMGNTTLAKAYGYQEDQSLENFSWNLAHLFAQSFGYISPTGKEIRVSYPDIAAYRIEFKDGVLTIYEYYDGIIVNIQKMTEVLRSKYGYEYYFKK